MQTQHWRIHLQMIGVIFFWGASWSWGRIIVQAMPPLTAAAIRFFIATAALLCWLLLRQGAAPLVALKAKQWLSLALSATFGVFGYAIFFMLALQSVPAGKAVTVAALNPVLPLLLAAWLFKERLNIGVLLGMVLSVTGALIAISHGHPIQLFAGGVGKGEYLLLCTVLCWTGYTLLGRMVLKDVSPLLTTTITAFFGAWFLLVAALFYEGTQAWVIASQAPISVWLCLLAMGLGATALTYLWFFAGVHALGVGTASAYIALVPVVGILIAALWLGEALDFSLLFGGALAVSGTLLMNLAKR